MADAVDAHEAAQAPPTSKAAGPPSMPAVSIDETPTEPATSPRLRPCPFYLEELRLPTREIGPRDEPEKFVTRWLVNDGSYADEEFDARLRKARQTFNNHDMELEAEAAVRREREAYEWERQIAARNLSDHRNIPRGPPPAGPSSMRALPDVHAALRQSDPSMAAHSQPVVKKAPPSRGRPMPPGFYSDKEPPRIGTPMQPPPPTTSRPDAAQGLNLLLASTPVTPSHPPCPPIDALPKHPSMKTGTSAIKHPLQPPVQQGPPQKQVRSKAFPYGPQQASMAASSAVDTSKPSTPCPKGPPPEYMPSPPEVMSMSTGASAAVQEPYVTRSSRSDP